MTPARDRDGAAALARLRAPLGVLVAQLFFIAAGVYLGNVAADRREERGHRAAARAALENFRTEMRRNRDVLRRRLPYHQALRDSVRAVLPRGPNSWETFFPSIGFKGLNPFTGSRTAWEVALATQSLSYLRPELAFAVADVYRLQEALAQQNDGFLRAAFTPATFGMQSPAPFAVALQAYLVDVATYAEPQLLTSYDRVLPAIDSALARLPR